MREREREKGCEQVAVDEVQYAVEDHHLVEFEGQDKKRQDHQWWGGKVVGETVIGLLG